MKKVSNIDVESLRIIRDGVTSIVKEGAIKYDKKNVLVLDIASEIWNGAKEFFTKSTIHTFDIDKTSNATFILDITRNNSDFIKDNTYDVVIFTEVLEHTLNPFNAINEIYRILKERVLIMTTPFNFRIHNFLPDCWRISEHGLKELLKIFIKVEINENGTERFLFPIQYKTIAIK